MTANWGLPDSFPDPAAGWIWDGTYRQPPDPNPFPRLRLWSLFSRKGAQRG